MTMNLFHNGNAAPVVDVEDAQAAAAATVPPQASKKSWIFLGGCVAAASLGAFLAASGDSKALAGGRRWLQDIPGRSGWTPEWTREFTQNIVRRNTRKIEKNREDFVEALEDIRAVLQNCSPLTGGNTRAIAALAPAPGYVGDSDPSGTVTVTYNPDGSFLMTLDAAGLDPACAAHNPEATAEGPCTVNIVDLTTCDGDSVPSHTVKSHLSFLAQVEGGFSNSAARITGADPLADNLGLAVLVVDSNSDFVGCGVLGAAAGGYDPDTILEADMGAYPGYAGDLEAQGTVKVFYRTDGTFKFEYDLTGLESNCEGCGIHIHAGKSCATHAEVMGHGWNSQVVQDLWTAAGGATYATDAAGDGKGHFNLYNGFGFGKNSNHAVVIHGQDGTRVGCGQLHVSYM